MNIKDLFRKRNTVEIIAPKKNKCKNEGCNNLRQNGSSRCEKCAIKK